MEKPEIPHLSDSLVLNNKTHFLYAFIFIENAIEMLHCYYFILIFLSSLLCSIQ